MSTAQPLLSCDTPAAYSAGVTAVTTTFDDGREQLTTFFPCAGWSSTCLLMAHIYLAWGLRGILPGVRDSLFSVQVASPPPPSATAAVTAAAGPE